MVTVSKWEITQSWELLKEIDGYEFKRQLATFIDLPDSYDTDLLFTNAHLFCCTADTGRQIQVDLFASFILDAKTEGGEITLPTNTPIIYAGDFNLVGYRQQLETILTGDIQYTNIFGNGAPLDWDNSGLTADNSLHLNSPFYYTWQDDSQNFLPGKLDFIFYSDSILEKEKSFVLETETQTEAILNEMSLLAQDTSSASDHLPVIADFSIKSEVLKTEEEASFINQYYPNPTDGMLYVNFATQGSYQTSVYNTIGSKVLQQEYNNNNTTIDLSSLANGMYYIVIKNNNGHQKTIKVLKK